MMLQLKRLRQLISGIFIKPEAINKIWQKFALLLPGVDEKKYKNAIERYKDEKKGIRKEAESLEAQPKSFDAQSVATMHVHHRWALAMTFIQIAISLAAITLFTRKKSMTIGVAVMAGGGFVFAMLALLHI